MTTNCDHSFISLGDITRTIQSDARVSPHEMGGVKALCVSCGEVRKAYADGVVVVVVKGSTPLDPRDLE